MFKKKEQTEKAPKNKKVRTMKVGTHKKSVLLLWAVLLASTSFGVYKNFTAIDTHTVHEKEIIQLYGIHIKRITLLSIYVDMTFMYMTMSWQKLLNNYLTVTVKMYLCTIS